VIFLGYGVPSAHVCNYVLAACAMASAGGSVLRGFVSRCFPYVSLVGIEPLLKMYVLYSANVSHSKGFIAGVTNPVFEEQSSWWDVLCDINTGKITISNRLLKTFAPSASTLSFAGSSSNIADCSLPAGARLDDADLTHVRTLQMDFLVEFVNHVFSFVNTCS
jgi:hypothetical protein